MNDKRVTIKLPRPLLTLGTYKRNTMFEGEDLYKDLATSTQKRNRFEIPLLIAVLRTKFPRNNVSPQNYKLMRNSEQM